MLPEIGVRSLGAELGREEADVEASEPGFNRLDPSAGFDSIVLGEPVRTGIRIFDAEVGLCFSGLPKRDSL